MKYTVPYLFVLPLMSLTVTRFHLLLLILPLVFTLSTTRHLLSLVVPLVVIRCHLLSLDVPLASLFISDIFFADADSYEAVMKLLIK